MFFIFISVIGKFQIADKWVNAKKAQEKNKTDTRGGMGGGRGKWALGLWLYVHDKWL